MLLKRKQESNRKRIKFSSILRAALLEPRRVEITHQPVVIPKLPSAFHGFRIAQLSDIHLSAYLSQAEILEAVKIANELKPDLFVLTGDYVSYARSFIPQVAHALGKLKAEFGVFAILGNHDHWTDGPAVKQALEDNAIRVLCNDNVKITNGDSYIRLAGIDDILVGRDDLNKALQGTDLSETRILLAHNPAFIRKAISAGIDLMLSGHTHGGQINWKLLVGREDYIPKRRFLRRRKNRLLRGYAQFGSTHLYVNRGLGTVVLPLRYGCSPEISVIELRSR